MTTRLPFTSTLSRVSLLERDMITTDHRPRRLFPAAAALTLPRYPSAPPLRRPSRPRPLLIGPTGSAACSYWTSRPPVSHPPASARGRAAAEAWSRPARSRRRVGAARGEEGRAALRASSSRCCAEMNPHSFPVSSKWMLLGVILGPVLQKGRRRARGSGALSCSLGTDPLSWGWRTKSRTDDSWLGLTFVGRLMRCHSHSTDACEEGLLASQMLDLCCSALCWRQGYTWLSSLQQNREKRTQEVCLQESKHEGMQRAKLTHSLTCGLKHPTSAGAEAEEPCGVRGVWRLWEGGQASRQVRNVHTTKLFANPPGIIYNFKVVWVQIKIGQITVSIHCKVNLEWIQISKPALNLQ